MSGLKHVSDKHPELLENADDTIAPSQMTDDESSDFVPQTLDEASLDSDLGTCQHCITALEKKDIAVRERRYNTSLDGVYLKCPYCDTAKAYNAMKEDEDGTPLASTGTCGDREAEKSASAPESLPCLFCGKSWDKREIQDHMTACLEDVTECPECVEEVKRKDYEEHIMQCSKTEAEKKAVDAPTNSQNVDDDSETRQKVEEIETLKQAIQHPYMRGLEHTQGIGFTARESYGFEETERWT
ncbi:hypothetical protein HPB50_025125 [Hyalomma asiaticum]|uniref:Uncharacterized protein n=1 Tax=Hyalomma asiaticum TaxID=266040 RepID=A0ACB7RQY4_HYAAI|nr:hypothetical protein HPB50_025125 [Hyalomma asiaticum]